MSRSLVRYYTYRHLDSTCHNRSSRTPSSAVLFELNLSYRMRQILTVASFAVEKFDVWWHL